MPRNNRPLDQGFAYEVDTIEKDAWHELLYKFSDASFFQTWSYGAMRWGKKNLNHLILFKSGKPVAITQSRIIKFPIINAGIAYIGYGPVWNLKDEQTDGLILRNVLRALYSEYVLRRGMFLLVSPKLLKYRNSDIEEVENIFREEHFRWEPDEQKTVVVDLKNSIDEIRSNTRIKWRQTLSKAEKVGLQYVEGNNDEICGKAMGLVKEMKDRKSFVEFGEMEEKIEVDMDLPDHLKMKYVISNYNNDPVAVLGWTTFGNVGLPLVNALGNQGSKLSASYPNWWKMIQYYKDNSFRICDLGGVNSERNPGGYVFKAGLAGKDYKEIDYIGRFEACNNIISQIGYHCGTKLVELYRKVLIYYKSLFKSWNK